MAVEVDEPMPAAVVEMPVEPKPDGKLEDRNGFEAAPPSRFQGMTEVQAGRRQFLDELTEEERDELIEAQLVRAETIEEPPLRPEAYIEPSGGIPGTVRTGQRPWGSTGSRCARISPDRRAALCPFPVSPI